MSDLDARERERLIDEIADQFESALVSGQDPGITQFVGLAPTSLQPALRIELVRMKQQPPNGWTRTALQDNSTAAFMEHPTKSSRQQGTPVRIGQWQVIHSLSDLTGQAELYYVVHPTTHIKAALKWLRSTHSHADSLKTMFLGEVAALKSLKHRGIPQFYEYGEECGRPYFVMEFIEGARLNECVRMTRPAPRRLARMVATIARALHAAHSSQILHRDIKPSNILVNKSETAWLIDFGLARMISAWAPFALPDSDGACTQEYCSPEQARGEQLDCRTDIFSLGGVLHWALTEKPPHVNARSQEGWERVKRGQLNLEFLNDAIAPGTLKRCCRKALTPDREGRFRSALAFSRSLERFVRRPWTVAAAAFLVLLASAFGFAFDKHTTALPQLKGPIMTLSVGNPAQPSLRDLDSSLSVPTSQVVHIQAEIPAGLSASMIYVDRAGHIQPLRDEQGAEIVVSADAPNRQLAGTFIIEGSPCTECYLICVARHEPPKAADIDRIVAWTAALPSLPEHLALRISNSGVQPMAKPREILVRSFPITPPSLPSSDWKRCAVSSMGSLFSTALHFLTMARTNRIVAAG